MKKVDVYSMNKKIRRAAGKESGYNVSKRTDVAISKERCYDIIRKPLMTEKAAMASTGEDNRNFVYQVDIKATKLEIKQAVEKIFNVEVESVNTVLVRGKLKRVGKVFGKRSNWKKAYVTLKEGHTINYIDGTN